MTTATAQPNLSPEGSRLRRTLLETPSVTGLTDALVVGLAASTLIGVVDVVVTTPLGTDANG
ncbi:MAG: hypothetical protein AAF742_00320 [Pseudomonadota bacterium]